jgi:hypothetical protein
MAIPIEISKTHAYQRISAFLFVFGELLVGELDVHIQPIQLFLTDIELGSAQLSYLVRKHLIDVTTCYYTRLFSDVQLMLTFLGVSIS